MGPVGRVPSNFGDRGDQVYNRVFGPLQILQLAVIFSLAFWKGLDQFKGERERRV